MLSMKTQYAFKALMYMAQQDSKRPILIAEIAEQKTIPLKFLENILLQLKKETVQAREAFKIIEETRKKSKAGK